MPYTTENDMYPHVVRWLKNYLAQRYRNADIRVFDSSRKSLSRLINQKGLAENLAPEWNSWDIHIDIVGFAIEEDKTNLAFVECKNSPIILAHLSQLFGYSIVAQPNHSFLISPHGISGSLITLLRTYNRIDVLAYSKDKGSLPNSIILARWDENSNSIDMESVITGDKNTIGRL